MRNTLLAATALAALALATPASATLILTFGQSASNSAVVATANGAGTSTTITSTNAPITVTQIDAATVVPTSAFFDLNITSTGAASTIGGGASQHYAGSFSITSGSGATGTNYLSGTFTDILLGVGPSGVLAVGSPPDVLSLTSSVIGPLVPPSAVALSFANLTPAFNITGTTVGSFTSSVSGTFSASSVAVPEPTSLALLGVGLLGLAFVSSRKRRHTRESNGVA